MLYSATDGILALLLLEQKKYISQKINTKHEQSEYITEQ